MKLTTKTLPINLVTPIMAVTLAGAILAGCTAQPSQPAAGSAGQPSNGAAKADQKVGDTTLSGTLTKAGDQFMLTVPGKPTTGLESYKIKLEEYVGKSVKVTGQYSGDTLFVSKIE